MSLFVVSEFFAERKKLDIQKFTVEGVEFELMALTEEQKSELYELAGNSAEMIAESADIGLSYDRNRVIDDEELRKDIDKLWSMSELDIDVEPSVKDQVGRKVIEMSGLTERLERMIENEEEKAESNEIDLDDLDKETTTLSDVEKLNADVSASEVEANRHRMS